MKFQFKIQPFQTKVAKSVVRVFSGQSYVGESKYRRDIGDEKRLSEDERTAHRGYMPISYSALSDEEKRFVDEEYETAYRNESIQIPYMSQQFSVDKNTTKVVFTENPLITNPYMRTLSLIFVNMDKTMELYLENLEKGLDGEQDEKTK